MEDYVVFSIETNLFFARIMKEHALFLEAGFPCKDKMWIQRADFFRQQFENLLRQTVELGEGIVGCSILNSEELVTEFTIPAEKRTSRLTGIPIDSRISVMEQRLQSGCKKKIGSNVVRMVDQMNEKAISMLNGLIAFKEDILEEIHSCNLFNANYPLLIEHIIREAKLYRSSLIKLQHNDRISCEELFADEKFWNRIMMEHALFIRGLLDPTEEELIETADNFAKEYEKLLEMAKKKDAMAMDEVTRKSLEETLKYREFKTAGTEGILECKIASLILPLLADHVLREANHYIQILKCCDTKGEE